MRRGVELSRYRHVAIPVNSRLSRRELLRGGGARYGTVNRRIPMLGAPPMCDCMRRGVELSSTQSQHALATRRGGTPSQHAVEACSHDTQSQHAVAARRRSMQSQRAVAACSHNAQSQHAAAARRRSMQSQRAVPACSRSAPPQHAVTTRSRSMQSQRAVAACSRNSP
eukprot:gene15069-biopygen207